MSLKQLLSLMLGAAFVAGVAGQSVAATGSMQGIGSADTVSQAPAPPDCKKDPGDPRCKDKKP